MRELYDAASGPRRHPRRERASSRRRARPSPPGASLRRAPAPPPAAPPEPAAVAEARRAGRRSRAARAGAGGGRGDLDGARLVALNMALNGESRAETERYLAENFELPDRLKLIDEVYAADRGLSALAAAPGRARGPQANICSHS